MFSVFLSSPSMTSTPPMAASPISFIFAVTAAFCTGLVLSASRLSSTAIWSIFSATLPSTSGVISVPFSVIDFIVPPPYSSQLAGVRKLSMLLAAKR